MHSYFIRHEGVQVEEAALATAEASGEIYLHYDEDALSPGTAHPDDYKGNGKRALQCFEELARDGGAVWAQWGRGSRVKIGIVVPGASIKVRSTRWANADREGVAFLKCLQLADVRSVPGASLLALRAARPQRGTICRWHACGSQLLSALGRGPSGAGWTALHPGQQEVIVSEFLRQHGILDLPKLEHLILPPGGNNEGIDIAGTATGARRLLVQVTFSTFDSVVAKLDLLRRYQADDVDLVLVCQHEKTERHNGILVIPTAMVEEWFVGQPGYSKQMLQ